MKTKVGVSLAVIALCIAAADPIGWWNFAGLMVFLGIAVVAVRTIRHNNRA